MQKYDMVMMIGRDMQMSKTRVCLMRRTFQVRIGILPFIWRLQFLITFSSC